MSNKDAREQASVSFCREIILKDCYKFRYWNHDFFDYIVDIGANVGIFSLFSSMRHVNAKVFAYEPCKETFEDLIKNVGFIPNVECVNMALGDGEDLFFYDTEWSGCNLFFKDEEMAKNLTYEINSCTLDSIFSNNDISVDNNYFIKIDCEGGERFLLDDKKAIDIIKDSCGSGIEVHFPPHGGNPRKDAMERFSTFPEWEVYNDWMNDNFGKTHEVIYHCSSKMRGSGVYSLIGK